MRIILVLALAASLSACATSGGLARANGAIAATQSKYDAARDFVGLFLPFLPPEQRTRIAAIGAVVEHALAAARAATSAAARAEAVAAAERATADYRLATGN